MFRSKKVDDTKFIQALNDSYEEIMENHFFSASTVPELEEFHLQTKDQVEVDLPSKWKEIMGSKKMPPNTPAKLRETLDQTFTRLKRHFELLKSKEDNRGLEVEAENTALRCYGREMEAFWEKRGSGGNLEEVTAAHKRACEAAIGMLKELAGVSAGTVAKVKDKLEETFEKHKARGQLVENSKDDPALGIDLGTTTCCVMVYYKGKLEVIPNRSQGSSRTTPSYVAYHDDGSDTFGSVAKEEAFRYPETTIYDAKRMIGRRWEDPNLQNDRAHWPFEVVEEEGHPKIRTWGTTRHPQEVSARLLAQFRVMADEHLGLPIGSVTKAVITVPAYFTEPQRRATWEAATYAGLEVLSIFSEPTAAAVAYSWERGDKKEGRKTVIYDLGGGTFDVAVAVVKADNVEILGVDGDTHLGGQDFDQLLMDYCIEKFLELEGINLVEGRDSAQKIKRDAVRSTLARLKMQCEKAKEWLSGAVKTTVNVERIWGDKHLVVTVTKDKLEELIRPLVQKTVEVVDRAISEAKTKGVAGKGDIDDVICVGGSTRVPLVTTMLGEYFKGKTLCKSINPDEAVAMGAAVQAAILKNRRGEEENGAKAIEVQDVTPMTLGTDKKGGLFSRIIWKNSKIPCEASVVYVTVSEDQTRMRFKVFQGESEKVAENKYLGEFVMDGIPPRGRGQESVKATMRIDANGILHVEAVAVSTRESKGITISSDRLVADRKGLRETVQKEIQRLAIRSHVKS